MVLGGTTEMCSTHVHSNWNRLYVKEQHDKHTFRILSVSLNIKNSWRFYWNIKNSFHFQSLYMSKTYALTYTYYSHRNVFIYALPESASFCCHSLMTYCYIKSKIYVTGNFHLEKPLTCYQGKSMKYFYVRD